MGKIIIDGQDQKTEIDAKDSKAGPVAYLRAKILELRMGSMGKEITQMRSEFRKDLGGLREVNRAEFGELKEQVDGETAKANLIHKELEEVKVAVREELKRMAEDAKVTQAAAALGAGVLMKGLLKKAIPWKKS